MAPREFCYILFDALQVKRIHEYKRQLLNILGIIYRYDCIKNMSPEERQKVCLIPSRSPKAFSPSFFLASLDSCNAPLSSGRLVWYLAHVQGS